MKKLFLLAATMLLVASCSTDSSDQPSKEYAEVRVQVKNFNVSVNDFPSSQPVTRTEESVSTYENLKVLMVAFYDTNNHEVYKSEQNRDTYTGTFGAFSCNLPVGKYTLVAIGRGHSDGDEFTLTNATDAAYTSARPRETFCHTQEVTITSQTPVDLSVTLERICSKIIVQSTDIRPYSVDQIRLTYSGGGKGFNPMTGLSATNTGFTVAYAGAGTIYSTTSDAKGYLFLASDEQTMNVTIDVIGDNNTLLFSKQVNDVPFKRNRVTQLQGALFSASPAAFTFKVRTDWETEQVINF